MGFRDMQKLSEERHAEIQREAYEALQEVDADLIRHGYTVNEASTFYARLAVIAKEMAFSIRRETHPYRRMES